jgi:hypothetical protein
MFVPCFERILELIQTHHIFHNNSIIGQALIHLQFMVVSYRFDHYANTISIINACNMFGIFLSVVKIFTNQYIVVILSMKFKTVKWPIIKKSCYCEN